MVVSGDFFEVEYKGRRVFWRRVSEFGGFRIFKERGVCGRCFVRNGRFRFSS